MDEINQRGNPRLYLRTLLFNAFINDLFLFIVPCTVMPMTIRCLILQQIYNFLSNLRIDCKIAIDWFDENGMRAHPNKFQLIIFLSRRGHQLIRFIT